MISRAVRVDAGKDRRGMNPSMPDDDIDWNRKIGPELSQEQIATILGVSRSTVSKFERSAMRKMRAYVGSDASGTKYEIERARHKRSK